MPRTLRPIWLLAALVFPAIQARDLTFEDRVQAQAAIERVYYAQQIGATQPFEEAVPRAVLGTKVEKYLKQSAALEVFWHTPVTAEMLERELARIANGTRMPERLRELFAALGDDPFLVRECLARPALVDRLTRNFFASDGRLQAAARTEAEELHRALTRYGVAAFPTDSRRTDVEGVRTDERSVDGPSRERETARLELSPERYARWRARAPQRPGEIGPLHEEREAFIIQVVLEETAASARVASFTVAKRSWDVWWEGTASVLAANSVEPAGGDAPLPAVSSCLPDDTWDNGSLDDDPDPRVDHTAVWTGSLMIVWGGKSVLTSSLNSGGRYDPATDSWTPTSTAGAPEARYLHTAVWTGTEMIVWGGSGGGVVNTGGRYDPANDTWTPTSTVGAPEARYEHTAVWTGNLMVVWGGSPQAGPKLNTGGRYEPATDTWTPTSTLDAPQGRHLHTAVWTGSRMVAWGGTPGSVLLDTGGRYDPVTDTWTPTSTVDAPAGRLRHTAVWTGSLMVVWGGYANPGALVNRGGRYDPATDTWTPTSTAGAPAPRTQHSAVWTGSRMVVWGGTKDGWLNTGGRYDPATDTWTPTSTAGAPEPRCCHTAVWTGSLMIAWGGGTGLDTGGRYDAATDMWTPTGPGTPAGRSGHRAVWTGSLMIVWGGADLSNPNAGYLNTGGRYDPALDTWTPTSTAQAPSARTNHTAVWTGSLMVVWGGYFFTGTQPFVLSTGGRYDPATDTWTPTSTAGAPSARYLHTAVWTGTEMIVWGGENFDDVFDSGARYDPANDTWTPTSTVDAPAGRSGHTAVWTGERMVVWGGGLDSGGRYDPATDTWTPTSTADAPSARYLHTAVWTGTEMIVWGGENFDDVFDSGARYDPATDTWTPTSTVDAPAGRSSHTAVWTGERMVVWGGINASTFLDTGGRYDPATDTWTPTSTAGAPEARSGHRAVWTGSLMIVWGGATYQETSSSGGRYTLAQATDDDGDGYSECDGDCNDADGSVYAVPAEITSLGFAADGVALEWDSAVPGAGSATVHDVLTGVLAEMPVGSGAAEACLDSTAASSIVVSDPPSSGSGYWYIVRGRNLCGDGTYGSASDGTPRESAACP